MMFWVVMISNHIITLQNAISVDSLYKIIQVTALQEILVLTSQGVTKHAQFNPLFGIVSYFLKGCLFPLELFQLELFKCPNSNSIVEYPTKSNGLMVTN